MMNPFLDWCIGGYQRWISPRKGFACAHRVAHGGVSCSEFSRRAIAEHGWESALPHILHRLTACSATMKILAESPQAAEEGESEPQKTESNTAYFCLEGFFQTASTCSPSPSGCDGDVDACSCSW